MKKLFLDDERLYPKDGGNWDVVRSFQQAVDWVKRNGFPHFISFDHDLGSDKTGLDFAKWLTDYDLSFNEMPDDFSFYVHSQNPIGKANIEGLLNQYIAFKRKNQL